MGFRLRIFVFQTLILFINFGLDAQPPVPGHGQDTDQIFGDLVRFEVTVDGSQTAGVGFNITITAKDGSDQTLTMFNGSVNLGTNNVFGAGVITTNISGFDNGVLTYEVNLTKAATNATITATHTGGSSTGTSDVFAVGHAALSSFLLEEDGNIEGKQEFVRQMTVIQQLLDLQILYPPEIIYARVRGISDQVAGESFDLRIRALDAFNNTVTNFVGEVDLSTNNVFGDGVVTATIGGFSEGEKLHPVSLTLVAADATITATRSDGPESGTSSSFNVLPASPAFISIIVPPSTVIAGANIEPSPVVRVDDEFGNPVPGVEVRVGLNTSTFASGSINIASTNQDGKAGFHKLSINISASNYYLVFTVIGHENVVQNSGTFNVLAESPAAMQIVTLAEQSVAGQPVEGPPTVKIVDRFNNPVPNINVKVTLNKQSFIDGSTTLLTSNSSGLAVFNNLVITVADTGYQLNFDVDGLKTLRMPIMNKMR